MPNQLNSIAYSDPRAVMVKAVGETVDISGEPHSAVSGNVVILTESMTDAQKLIKHWPRVIAAVSDRIDELLKEGL